MIRFIEEIDSHFRTKARKYVIDNCISFNEETIDQQTNHYLEEFAQKLIKLLDKED